MSILEQQPDFIYRDSLFGCENLAIHASAVSSRVSLFILAPPDHLPLESSRFGETKSSLFGKRHWSG
jgi:hypothetical protein